MTTARESALRGLIARDVVVELGARLGRRGIPWVALKGAALHAWGCLSAEQRRIEDLDVLVPEARLDEALGVAKKLGFEPVARSAAAVTLFRRATPLPLDLHFRPFEPGLFRLQADDVLGSAVEHDGVRVPAPLDLYAHLVGHFAKGRLNARDRAHLRDFGAMSRHFHLEPSSVARHLEEHGLSRAARYTLSIARDIEHDFFAEAVLFALRKDTLGDLLAALSRRVLSSRRTPAIASLAVSVLDESLPRAARGWVLHGAEALRRRCRVVRGHGAIRATAIRAI